MTNLVISYLGDSPPNYVFQNLIRISSQFSNHEVTLLANSSRSLKRAREMAIQTWDACDSYEKWKGQLATLEHDTQFRNGFWVNTLARLLVLCDYVRETRKNQTLQVEADVVLLNNFPITEFDSIQTSFAYGIENEERGIAALLFIKDANSAQFLLDFIENSLKMNLRATDMTVLGNLLHQHPNMVTVLPSLIDIDEKELTSNIVRNCLVTNSNFRGLFDPISIGQYYFGEDPRNHRGIRIRGRWQAHHLVDPRKMIFKVNRDGEVRVKNVSGMSWPLFSIHNHAKDRRLFLRELDRNFLVKRFRPIEVEKREVVLGAFFSGIFGAIRRRLSTN